MKTQINTLPFANGIKAFTPIPRVNTALYAKRSEGDYLARFKPTSNNSDEDGAEPIDYFKFAEKVNGRSAMQGFVWGSLGTAMTGKSVGQQLIAGNVDSGYYLEPQALLGFAVVVGLVTLGTALTSTISPDNELIEKSAKYNIKGFTPKAELTNGRLAMLGFVALLLSGAFMAN